MSAPATTRPRFPLLAQLSSRDPLDIAPRLTLLLVVPLDPAEPVISGVMVTGACLLALSPVVYRSPWLWLAITGVRGWGQWQNWIGLDNHLILITYWCLALALVLFSNDPKRALALTAALLIGLTFAFATFWKLTSGQFVDGRFFEFTLLFDPRFEWIAQWAGGLSESVRSANLDAYSELRSPTLTTTEVQLQSAGRVGLVAWIMTIYGIVLEATIAILFLLSRRIAWVPTARFVTILLFCGTTFVLAPVIYFGLLLLTMAYVQCSETFRHRGWLLVVMLGLVAWLPVYDTLAGVR